MIKLLNYMYIIEYMYEKNIIIIQNINNPIFGHCMHVYTRPHLKKFYRLSGRCIHIVINKYTSICAYNNTEICPSN